MANLGTSPGRSLVNERIKILRQGWLAAADEQAPDISGLRTLLEQGLDKAAGIGDQVTESALLAIVDDATGLVEGSGNATAAHALGKRLRRTVYEYLLSFDSAAQRSDEPEREMPKMAPASGELIGAEEVAALFPEPERKPSRFSLFGRGGKPPLSMPESEEMTAEIPAPEPARLPESDVFEPRSEAPAAELEPETDSLAAAMEPAATASAWAPQMSAEQTAADSVLEEFASIFGEPSPGEGANGEALSGIEASAPEARVTEARAAEAPDAEAPIAEPAAEAPIAEPAAEAPVAEPLAETPEAETPAPLPIAPKSGFHIGDPSDFTLKAPPVELEGESEQGAASEAQSEVPRFQAFETDWKHQEPTEPAPAGGPLWPPEPVQPARSAAREARPLPAQPPVPAPAADKTPARPEPAEFSLDMQPAPRDFVLRDRDAPLPPLGGSSAGETAAEAQTGSWGIREPKAVRALREAGVEAFDQMSAGRPGLNINQVRLTIDAKMKKKKCDDAASTLQQYAQEYGGREVAELALDTGDRCRAMGKHNASLNCYLAASRADPVYEDPLVRLSDICIEERDIDLAVSYLERIARLTRLRGDVKGALRIYRKIATIAPYRDDVLELLMRVQTTGRLDI